MLAGMPSTHQDTQRRLRRPQFVRHYGYGLVLVMILASLSFQLATSDSDEAQAVTILLQAATLLVAVWASESRHIVIRIVELAVAVVVVGASATFLISGSVDDGAAKIVNLLLIAFAPLSIGAGIVRHFREEGMVTFRTMFGVLCIYLLIGSFFAFCYGAVGAISDTRFFAETAQETSSDFLYFSFSTLTTTGFGDLTAATDLGRSLTITEALIGQIYLVTIVAVIVGNLRRPATRRDA
jgi:Ion channel